jgi:hypothetical protein
MEMSFLSRAEIKIEIKTTTKEIYNILNNDAVETVWNITVNENTEIAPDKFSVKSNVGDFIITKTERVENEKISYSIEGGAFSKMGYIISPKGDGSEVMLWGEFDDEKDEKMLVKAGEILLQSLKKYAEYLKTGGAPEDYKKK